MFGSITWSEVFLVYKVFGSWVFGSVSEVREHSPAHTPNPTAQRLAHGSLRAFRHAQGVRVGSAEKTSQNENIRGG